MEGIQTVIDGHLVINTTTSDAAFSDIFHYVAEHNAQWSDRSVVWDLREFDFEKINADDLKNHIGVGAKLSKMREGLSTAIVISTDLGFGMRRMFSIMAEMNDGFQTKIEAFRSMAEAKAWLGHD